MNKIVVYGIKNCDSMKKAFNFLDKHNVRYDFHNFKKDGLDISLLESICKHVDLEVLINKRGTTYRKLNAQGLSDIHLPIVVENPSIIKRPLMVVYNEKGEVSKVYVGLQDMEKLL